MSSRHSAFKLLYLSAEDLKPQLCTWHFSTHLEARPLTGKALVVQHGLQDFFMPAGHQTHGAHNLQHGHLGLDVLCSQALGNDVDAL